MALETVCCDPSPASPRGDAACRSRPSLNKSGSAGSCDTGGTPLNGASSTLSPKTNRSCRTQCSSPKWVTLNGIQQQVRRYGAGSAEDSHWIQSVQADCFFASAIAVHSIVLGFDVEMHLRQSHSQGGDADDTGHLVLTWGLVVVRGLLLLVFTAELMLRSLAWGRQFLCSLSGVFDVFLVVTGWADVILVLSGVALTDQVSAAMHSCRLLRLVRIFRIFAIVPALRLICAGLMATTVASLWAVSLLLLFAYVGALLCTDILGEQPGELNALFGHVLLSMLTHVKLALVEAWPDIAEPMMQHSRFWALYLTAFMLVCNMALLNVVTGLICEKVMDIAHKQPPLSEEERLEASHSFEQELWRLYHSADINSDGYVCEAEYLELLKTREMQEQLQNEGIGLPLDHLHILTVLDQDNNGSLSFDEFFDGLMRQRGTRSDHLSQSLQYDLAERTNHVLTGVAATGRSAKASARRSVRQARHRVLHELKRHAKKGSAPQRPGAEESEVVLCDGLSGLEDASIQLRERLQGLRSACLHAGTTVAWQKPRPLALEDIYLEDAPQGMGFHEAVAQRKIKFIAGTGSIGDRSSGSESCRDPRDDREGSSGSDHSGHEEGGADARAGSSADRSSSSSNSGSRCGRSRSQSSSGSSGSSGSRSGNGNSPGGDRWSTFAERGSPVSPRFGSLMPLGAAAGGFGTLHVQVLGVHGLRSSGDVPFTGSFDTYVVLRIGYLECRTPTACYNMGAAWAFGEPRAFDLRRQPPNSPTAAAPSLLVEVMNAWLVSDDTLGAASLDLADLEPGRWHRRRKRLRGRQGGELELALLLDPEEALSPVGSRSPDRWGCGDSSRHDGDPPQSRGSTPGSRHAPPALEAHLQADDAKSRRHRSPISRGEEEGGAGGSATSSGSAFPGLEKVLARRDARGGVPKLPGPPEKILGSSSLFAAAPTVYA